MEIKELQQIQKDFDRTYWHHINNPNPEQIRHITLHLGKLLGKLSVYCEQQEHEINYSDEQIRREVIPDLLSHSLRLSNLLGEDAEQLYRNRLNNIGNILQKYK